MAGAASFIIGQDLAPAASLGQQPWPLSAGQLTLLVEVQVQDVDRQALKEKICDELSGGHTGSALPSTQQLGLC